VLTLLLFLALDLYPCPSPLPTVISTGLLFYLSS